ncbi:hypothetical protein HanRHA438_Chr17g0816991 [Helianthus annuus]|nr:hypothetical protein HanHA89_Chr17g0709971 [Helianthus annuus]KAJ0632744.1 hypothetical protein HanLR1_Chr17g0668541 [Helianthus annuus]KAJ0826680.1 hypothetical protein HanRHA438_Chr17g0816991 [Helianthus annuus]
MPNKQPCHHTLGITHRGGLNLASNIRYSLSHSLITLIKVSLFSSLANTATEQQIILIKNQRI